MPSFDARSICTQPLFGAVSCAASHMVPRVTTVPPEPEFDVPAKESRGYSWKIKVPDGLGFLTYKVVASTGRVSDGEEGALPVLSRRIFVTESLPLPIRGPGSKKFDFTKLGQSGKSSTLAHQSGRIRERIDRSGARAAPLEAAVR